MSNGEVQEEEEPEMDVEALVDTLAAENDSPEKKVDVDAKVNAAVAGLQRQMEMQVQALVEEKQRMQNFFEAKIREMAKKEEKNVLEISDGEDETEKKKRQILAAGLSGALQAQAGQQPFGVQRAPKGNNVSSPYTKERDKEKNKEEVKDRASAMESAVQKHLEKEEPQDTGQN